MEPERFEKLQELVRLSTRTTWGKALGEKEEDVQPELADTVVPEDAAVVIDPDEEPTGRSREESDKAIEQARESGKVDGWRSLGDDE